MAGLEPNGSGADMAFLTRQEMLLGSLKPEGIAQRAKFEARAERFFKKTGKVTGLKAWVRSDPELERKLIARMNRVNPALARAFTRRLVPVAEHAQENWPVKSGLSQALLSLRFFERGADRFAARLHNPAPYANLIAQGKIADLLVFRPGGKAVSEIADDVAREVAR